MDLKFYEVETGRALGNGMFNLQTGIHLHEPDAVGLRFVEKLHGAGIAVAGGLTQTNRGLANCLIFLLRKHRGRRFLQDFLMAALYRAVTDAQRPRRPIAIGNNLDLDMARALDQMLKVYSGIAESLGGLGPSALESLGQLGHRLHTSNSPAASTRRGLNKERKAQALSMRARILESLDRSATPRGDRYL